MSEHSQIGATGLVQLKSILTRAKPSLRDDDLLDAADFIHELIRARKADRRATRLGRPSAGVESGHV